MDHDSPWHGHGHGQNGGLLDRYRLKIVFETIPGTKLIMFDG